MPLQRDESFSLRTFLEMTASWRVPINSICKEGLQWEEWVENGHRMVALLCDVERVIREQAVASADWTNLDASAIFREVLRLVDG